MNITLRIKKRFLDAIAKGEKKTEYRSCSKFYDQVFAGKIETLTLHYQTSRRVVVEVLTVEKISKPDELKSSPFLTTDSVYAIRLGKIIDERF